MDTRLLDQTFPILAERAGPGAFALGVMNLGTTQTWYWNIDRGFPLAGAAALPIAVAAMAQVDARRLALDAPVRFTALDLSPPPSIIDQHWPDPPQGHSGAIPLQSLFPLALRRGDETAMDLLLARIGGPGAVSAFLQSKGITAMHVDRYQRQIGVALFGMPTFRPAWKDKAAFAAARDQTPPAARQAAMDHFILDPHDTTTVPAALGFLDMLTTGQLVSAASAARVLGWIEANPASLFRAGLPRDADLASVAGATPTDLGFTAATTELAIVTFPGAGRFALAGFLVGSTATPAARRDLFAQAAALTARAVA